MSGALTEAEMNEKLRAEFPEHSRHAWALFEMALGRGVSWRFRWWGHVGGATGSTVWPSAPIRSELPAWWRMWTYLYIVCGVPSERVSARLVSRFAGSQAKNGLWMKLWETESRLQPIARP